MNFLWATRGKTWGFRFLRTGGLQSPLAVYEEAFVGTEGMPKAFKVRNETLAVRFPDPDGRTDRAGRVIPHEFVILAPDHARFLNADTARVALWGQVGERYAAVWEESVPPTADTLG